MVERLQGEEVWREVQGEGTDVVLVEETDVALEETGEARQRGEVAEGVVEGEEEEEEPQQLGQEALEVEAEEAEEAEEALETLVLPPTLPPHVQALVRAVGVGVEEAEVAAINYE